jgi:hypothetical protein
MIGEGAKERTSLLVKDVKVNKGFLDFALSR